MLAIAKDINSDMNNKDVKGVASTVSDVVSLSLSALSCLVSSCERIYFIGFFNIGTEDNTDYSIDGMLAIAKDINSDMNNKDVKGVVLVLNKKYSEDVRYFLSLTVKDDKPLVIIPYDYNNGSPDYKVAQAKKYIDKELDKTDNADNQLPEGFLVNVNDYSESSPSAVEETITIASLRYIFLYNASASIPT